MKHSSPVEALGFLCLLLADGLPISEKESPVIIGPSKVQLKAYPGEQLVLHCDASNCDKDETVIYWLINGVFPEDTVHHGRIVELNEFSSEEGLILQRSLLLKNVTSEDFESTFSCVVTNASGTDRKHTVITKRKEKQKKAVNSSKEPK